MQQQIERYAKLILQKGLALERGQAVVINVDVENAAFARRFAQCAYELGAGEVEVRFHDERLERTRFLHAPYESFAASYPGFRAEGVLHFLRRGACIVDLVSPDPDGMQGVEPDRLRHDARARSQAYSEYRHYIGTSRTRWCVAALPGRRWAEKLFPGERDGVDRLWRQLLICAHADGNDPCGDWERHVRGLGELARRLDELELRELHFTTGLGTDLRLELAERARWLGGEERDAGGVIFSPNIPTEEVCTVPHRYRAAGRMVASRPLCHEGKVVENLTLRLEGGAVTECTCTEGERTMQDIFALDANMNRLGEIALVPSSSPVMRSGMLFYQTLLDENAACHLALGSGARSALRGSPSSHQAQSRGLNLAKAHVDIVFGTADLRCTGRSERGEQVLLMEHGELSDALLAARVAKF